MKSKRFIRTYPGYGRVESLATCLMLNGYDVTIEHLSSDISQHSTRKFAKKHHAQYPVVHWISVVVSGKGIQAAFCTKNDYSYPVLNYHIAADPDECFNKWSQCSVVLSLATRTNHEILEYLALLTDPEVIKKATKWEKIVHDLTYDS